jgi:hypothetical protein
MKLLRLLARAARASERHRKAQERERNAAERAERDESFFADPQLTNQL